MIHHVVEFLGADKLEIQGRLFQGSSFRVSRAADISAGSIPRDSLA
jgi:hypothetical protein